LTLNSDAAGFRVESPPLSSPPLSLSLSLFAVVVVVVVAVVVVVVVLRRRRLASSSFVVESSNPFEIESASSERTSVTTFISSREGAHRPQSIV